LELSGREDAARMALRLRDPAQAESLAAMAGRQHLGYVSEIGAATDSALFAEGLAAGPGAVVGPDSTGSGWVVARVEAVLPGRLRSFDEARSLVEHQWYGVEGERRMTGLIARLRRRTTVVTNERALARLTVP
ncbi:MAG TPA: peptidylprolyl isomerase, partial [Candidatus Eisenbacteria bacterium]